MARSMEKVYSFNEEIIPNMDLDESIIMLKKLVGQVNIDRLFPVRGKQAMILHEIFELINNMDIPKKMTES